MTHQLISYIWNNSIDNPQAVTTCGGDAVEVIQPGDKVELNTKRDFTLFCNTEINISGVNHVGDTLFVDNLTKWETFKANYPISARTVRIVAAPKDTIKSTIYNDNIIYLSVIIPEALLERYFAVTSSYPSKCAKFWEQYRDIDGYWVSSRLIMDRLDYKKEYIKSVYYDCGSEDWNETFTFLLFDTIKIKTANRINFVTLCKLIRANKIVENLSTLEEVEAILFGAAGLLLPVRTNDEYVVKLQNIFREQSAKYMIKPMEGRVWDFSGGSLYHLIAQLAVLLHSRIDFVQDIANSAVLDNFNRLLKLPVSEYWQRREMFCAPPSIGANQLLLSQDRVDKIIINAIVPMLIFRDSQDSHPDYDYYANILEQMKEESNIVIRKWKNAGLTIDNSLVGQCLLHLDKYYCTPQLCTECVIFDRMK